MCVTRVPSRPFPPVSPKPASQPAIPPHDDCCPFPRKTLNRNSQRTFVVSHREPRAFSVTKPVADTTACGWEGGGKQGVPPIRTMNERMISRRERRAHLPRPKVLSEPKCFPCWSRQRETVRWRESLTSVFFVRDVPRGTKTISFTSSPVNNPSPSNNGGRFLIHYH